MEKSFQVVDLVSSGESRVNLLETKRISTSKTYSRRHKLRRRVGNEEDSGSVYSKTTDTAPYWQRLWDLLISRRTWYTWASLHSVRAPGYMDRTLDYWAIEIVCKYRTVIGRFRRGTACMQVVCARVGARFITSLTPANMVSFKVNRVPLAWLISQNLVTKAANEKKSVIVISSNITKAFDCISHSKILMNSKATV